MSTVTWEMKALVEATDNSLPQFKKTPQFSSLARVDMTLFTTLSLVRPACLAILKGMRRSIVSPDYETAMKPPFLTFKSFNPISEAVLASM